MVRYFYSWTPLVIVGTVVLLSLPWLGVIALMVVAFVAIVLLAGLTWALVAVPWRLVRAVNRGWHGRTGSSPWGAAASGASRHPHPYVAYGTPQLAGSTDVMSAAGSAGAPDQPGFRPEDLA